MMLVVNIINHQQQKPHHKLIENKFSTHIKLIKISMHVSGQIGDDQNLYNILTIIK